MKKIIMIIMLGMVLSSLGGCFIPYPDDGGGYREHGRDRDDRHDRDREDHRR
jgi:hypothetical protein